MDEDRTLLPDDAAAATAPTAALTALPTAVPTAPTAPTALGEAPTQAPEAHADEPTAYVIHTPLAAGGMGEAYVASSPQRQGDMLVMKVLTLLGGRGGKLSRLRHEASALLKLRHPHIVSLLDAGELSNRTPFLILEHAQGEVLSQVMARWGRVPTQMTVLIGLQILDALTYAHAQGVIHRDLKPDNVILNAEGGAIEAKVLDFGLAHLVDELSSGTALTGDGAIVGTLPYMAPEQLVGDAVDGRCDLYALGLMLFEMLTGQRPHAAEATIEALVQRVTATPPDPALFGADDLPPALSYTLKRALEPDPRARFQTPAEMSQALAPAATLAAPDLAPLRALSVERSRELSPRPAHPTQRIPWPPPLPPPPAPPHAARRYLGAVSGLLCALALVGLTTDLRDPPPPAAQPPSTPPPPPPLSDLSAGADTARKLLGEALLWGWELHRVEGAWTQRAWFIPGEVFNRAPRRACAVELRHVPDEAAWRGVSEEEPPRCAASPVFSPRCEPSALLALSAATDPALSAALSDPDARLSLRYAADPQGQPTWLVEAHGLPLQTHLDATCAAARSKE